MSAFISLCFLPSSLTNGTRVQIVPQLAFYDRQKAILRLTDRCANLSSEGLDIIEYITSDTQRKVWVIRIPKHLPKRPVYAHDKAWQRIEDSLVELTSERLNTILDEPLFTGSDWSAEIVPNATIDDLDEVAIAKARVMFKWERRFPMPDYEIDAAKKEVAVRLYGNAINEKYTKLLKENKDLSFEDCLLLDAVQKGHQLNDVDAQNLLSRGLVEVQDNQYYISLDVARKTKQVPEYTKSKGLEKQKLIQMILQYLKNAGEEGSKRDGIYEYLKDVLPQNKTREQQLRMLGDLLNYMKDGKLIMAKGRTWYDCSL